mmetsp:Transcript_40775/g.102641  ORF Transcript_40775/g.102641 Transcript_40775/m.102641 type:complete len:102 (-) Transcript_40775:93-398(-)
MTAVLPRRQWSRYVVTATGRKLFADSLSDFEVHFLRRPYDELVRDLNPSNNDDPHHVQFASLRTRLIEFSQLVRSKKRKRQSDSSVVPAPWDPVDLSSELS